MKSIRVSLIVYFLALLLLGLGGVSLLAYRTAASTLDDKEANGRLLIETEFQAREKEAREEFDASLLRKARQVVSRQSRPYHVEWLNVLPALGTPAAPFGYLNLAVDLRLGTPPLSSRLTPFQLRFQETRSLDHFVPTADDDDNHPWEACQTYFPNGQTWERTNNLAFQPMSLDDAFREAAKANKPLSERFDEVKIGPLSLRRVTIKASRRYNAPSGPSGGQWKGGFRGGSPNFGDRWRAMAEPYFILQYAADTTPLDNRLADLAQLRKQRIDRLGEETSTTLSKLRQRLVYVCGLTAISVLVGGLLLIWMGLAPLHRLSEAVSQINEKDFQLRIDPQSLPSELQPVAQRLRQSLDQLRNAFAREKQAAQDISHDLRTPLAALTTTIEVALKKDRTTAEYRELIEECQISAQQMSHLVERLLALARIDSGSNPVRPRPVDVVQIVHGAIDVIRPLAKARNLSVEVHAPSEVPMLADADKLRDVLVNLLHNAVDYNRESGAIDVRIAAAGATMEIEVADTGAGIRPEAKRHLFERFYRADPSRHTDTPHCGLGLAIVKSYVELMNGTIEVDSEPDVGTTFRIRLPYVGLPVEPTAVRARPTEVLA